MYEIIVVNVVNVVNCGKWRKNSKSHRDLDLDPTMPIIELVRDIFIYNIFKFHVPRLQVIMQKHTNTHRHTLARTQYLRFFQKRNFSKTQL